MEMSRLEIKLRTLSLRTPLLTSSGTSGTTNELSSLKHSKVVLKSLGAFVTKGVTLKPRQGNPELRVVETRTGLLNSIGLQNSGAKAFMKEELPKLLFYRLPIIVNISASSINEFGALSAYLMENDDNAIISGLEINVSCPNVDAGGAAFGIDPKIVEKVVKAVRKSIRKDVLIITKLTPNVTDITIPAKGAINGGTDVLSMINTLRAMAINIRTEDCYLGNKTGGLSGPAIKPVGVYMVYECFKSIPECRNRRIPIIGIGGISNWEDALEYIMAGASAVAIGTAWFVNSNVFEEVHRGLEKYCEDQNTTIAKKIGCIHGRR